MVDLTKNIFNTKDFDFFRSFLDKNQILYGDDKKKFSSDWTNLNISEPSIVLFPKNTKEVSSIMKYCFEQNLKVVPSGGLTGLAGGANVLNNEIVVNLSKMNKIKFIDKIGLSIQVEAGVTTKMVQDAALNEGLYFGIDLSAKGSSQIGGNIATNIGGLRFIKFGDIKRQVLGLEIVLADGRILDLNYNLLKNNTGYDLKNIFIGSEGTLGIITSAILKLSIKPKNNSLACLGFENFDNILKTLENCNLSSKVVSAFEFFTDLALEKVLKFNISIKNPFENIYPYYVILELEESNEDFEKFLMKLFDLNLIEDVVLANSSAQYDLIWSIRENISESLDHFILRKNDISLPIAYLNNFMENVKKNILIDLNKNIEIIFFGHIGDGNIHLNYIAPKSFDKLKFDEIIDGIQANILDIVKKYKGSISAEHGIGILKKNYLHYSRNEMEIDLMRKIKNIFDEKKILNPNKIFD